MLRALTLAVLVAILPGAASGQPVGVLHIKVTLTDAAGALVPVARHALLISDNPATSTPRRIVTTTDGTADVRLPPGNYTVESDEPFAFNGKGYQWTQTLDVRAGRDVVLALTAANAEVGAAPAVSASGASKEENDPSLLLPQWKDSIVAVWTPESRASGFVVDAAGLVVTSQHAIGNASVIEVQLTAAIKVAARILAADRARDVTVLWIDPEITAALRPVPLACSDASKPPFAEREKLMAIGAPLHGQTEVFRGEVIRVDAQAGIANFRLAPGSIGGPVFTAAGSVVGLSSVVEDEDERRRRDARVVPVADVCAAVSAAEKTMQTTERPVRTHLPVEPLTTIPAGALEAEAKRRVGNLSPYRMSTSDFDIAFLTPVQAYSAQQGVYAAQQGRQAAAGFGDWSDYFADGPPVLVVRATPKFTESFWTTVARGAAYTQGAALPPIKHFKPGFSRLRVLCGDVEVAPIHPFILQQRVSETDAVREGLYVFDPQALGPSCTSVKLVLYSEKTPEKPDTRAVDPRIIERIRDDFAYFSK